MKNIYSEPEVSIINLAPQDVITGDDSGGQPGVEDSSGVW
jgi:hypothetical protein